MQFKPRYKLRQPTGPYLVGCSHFVCEYTSEAVSDEKRLIPCLWFYPAVDSGAAKRKPYIDAALLPGAGEIETNAYRDAPIAAGQHPLLLFNHGFSLTCESNTVQFEELASYGYIVLSIGHPGDGSYALPTGELLLFDGQKMMADFQKESEVATEMFPRYWKWLMSAGKAASLEEHRAYYQSIIDAQPKMVGQTAIWVQDSLAALNHFLRDKGQHVAAEKIGAFGMSFGGSTALSLTHASDRIKASADLDGFYFSPLWQQPLTKPALLLQHDTIGGYFLTFPYLNAAHDAYLVTIQNTTHSNFMDFSEILADNPVTAVTIGGEEVELTMLGQIDPSHMETVLNRLLLDFFNKYLQGEPSQVIDSPTLLDGVSLIRK